MNELDRSNLDKFLKAIEPNLAAYNHASFGHLALRKGEVFELTEGCLLLHVSSKPVSSGFFQSENVRAGICPLSDLKLSPEEVIESLLAGSLRTPMGELIFPPKQGQPHSIHFSPLHQDGILRQCRQMQLNITGNERQHVDPTIIDWELKASPTPFDGIQDLCNEYSIGPISGDFLNVKVIAFRVAEVMADSSVEGSKANVGINLAEGLDRHKASIGYRVIEKNEVMKRGSLPGSELTWANMDHLQQGRSEIEVPAGAVVHCMASYYGIAQHYYWILDQKTAPNPFRSVHQAFDNNLEVLQELIVESQVKGAKARDLEIAVAWLLWILGFSTTHIGGTPRTSDAPDLIASTPLGNFLVIECTTGILKEDNKLAHLIERSEKVRQSLAASGNAHLRVLPLLATTKTRDEVKTDLEQAHKLGVLVATKEDFQEVINRTITFPDPNRLYAEAEEALRRLQNPPMFPGHGK